MLEAISRQARDMVACLKGPIVSKCTKHGWTLSLPLQTFKGRWIGVGTRDPTPPGSPHKKKKEKKKKKTRPKIIVRSCRLKLKN
jgi:hypothetical protein